MCRQQKAMLGLTLLTISISIHMTTSHLFGIDLAEETLRESETFHQKRLNEIPSEWVPLTQTLTGTLLNNDRNWWWCLMKINIILRSISEKIMRPRRLRNSRFWNCLRFINFLVDSGKSQEVQKIYNETFSRPSLKPTSVLTVKSSSHPLSAQTALSTSTLQSTVVHVPTFSMTSSSTRSLYSVKKHGKASTYYPTSKPTSLPTLIPTSHPTSEPTIDPTLEPTLKPTSLVTSAQTVISTRKPSIPYAKVYCTKSTFPPTLRPTVVVPVPTLSMTSSIPSSSTRSLFSALAQMILNAHHDLMKLL